MNLCNLQSPSDDHVEHSHDDDATESKTLSAHFIVLEYRPVRLSVTANV